MTGRRIHVVGASGSGTTTLGAALAEAVGARHLDTDEYFWMPTTPPFEQPRDPEARRTLLGADLTRHPAWVLSGSLCGWGDVFIPLFDLVVFLAVPTPVRLERLRARERARYGADVAEGGPLQAKCTAFLAWAASYDDGPAVERSRAMHEAWLAKLPCPVLRLEDLDDVETRMKRVLDF